MPNPDRGCRTAVSPCCVTPWRKRAVEVSDKYLVFGKEESPKRRLSMRCTRILQQPGTVVRVMP
jgi:hypothetical protein